MKVKTTTKENVSFESFRTSFIPSLKLQNELRTVDLLAILATVQLPKSDRCTVLRIEQHEDGGCVLVSRSQVKSEALDHYSKGQFGLKNGKILTDARTSSKTEWYEPNRVFRSTRHSVCESIWIEFVYVVTPYCLIVMDSYDWDQKLRATWDFVPS